MELQLIGAEMPSRRPIQRRNGRSFQEKVKRYPYGKHVSISSSRTAHCSGVSPASIGLVGVSMTTLSIGGLSCQGHFRPCGFGGDGNNAYSELRSPTIDYK